MTLVIGPNENGHWQGASSPHIQLREIRCKRGETYIEIDCRACEVFVHCGSQASDVGLPAKEIDSSSGEQLENFSKPFSHTAPSLSEP